MKQPLEDLMQRIRIMGQAERHTREVACLDRGRHDTHVMGIAGSTAFTYCNDCLLLFINDVAVNSTIAT